MDITGESRVLDLVRTFPYLKDFLVGYAPAFEQARQPAPARDRRHGSRRWPPPPTWRPYPPERLVADVRAEVERRSGDGEGVEPGRRRAARRRSCKAIIRDLHAARPSTPSRRGSRQLAAEVDASEIAAMEQALIAEGMPPSEVQRLCDVHVEVFRDALDQPSAEERARSDRLPEGHPADTYLRENEQLGALHRRRAALRARRAVGGRRGRARRARAAARRRSRRLAEVDTHYTRKENQLFPLLERHGVSGPTKVMWGLHDEIRAAPRAAARRAAEDGDAQSSSSELPRTLGMIEDMAYKEERILLPVALEELTRRGVGGDGGGRGRDRLRLDRAAGCARSRRRAAVPRRGRRRAAAAHDRRAHARAARPRAALPARRRDVRRRDGPRPLLLGGRPRLPAQPGHHRPRGARLPSAQERGRRGAHHRRVPLRAKDTAEFWIELHGRFVYIRYFAVRDDGGAFRGVLEVTQDATEVRELEGQRRLLDWE